MALLPAKCTLCQGSGKRLVPWNGARVTTKCHGCGGRGKVGNRSPHRGQVRGRVAHGAAPRG
jgi:DnaJ-class molecular chaperone